MSCDISPLSHETKHCSGRHLESQLRRAAGAGEPIFGAVRLSVSCHRRATGFSVEVSDGSLRHGLGQDALPVVRRVQVNQCGPAAGVAHAIHQLAETGAGDGATSCPAASAMT
jgi:hypothetical protein